MADNVDYTPGTGIAIASDDIGGVQYQRNKLVIGNDGVNNGDVSASNPLPTYEAGELLQAIQALRMAVEVLSRSSAGSIPDMSGRNRVLLDSITAGVTLPTVTTVTGVTTVSTVTSVTTLANQTNIGGTAANDVIPAFMRMSAGVLRNNIVVT